VCDWQWAVQVNSPGKDDLESDGNQNSFHVSGGLSGFSGSVLSNFYVDKRSSNTLMIDVGRLKPQWEKLHGMGSKSQIDTRKQRKYR
jgi:hypothetical protein